MTVVFSNPFHSDGIAGDAIHCLLKHLIYILTTLQWHTLPGILSNKARRGNDNSGNSKVITSSWKVTNTHVAGNMQSPGAELRLSSPSSDCLQSSVPRRRAKTPWSVRWRMPQRWPTSQNPTCSMAQWDTPLALGSKSPCTRPKPFLTEWVTVKWQ